jgi:hypothetical protein
LPEINSAAVFCNPIFHVARHRAKDRDTARVIYPATLFREGGFAFWYKLF